MTGKLHGNYLDKGQTGRIIVPEFKYNAMKQPELGKRISELRKANLN